MWPVAAGVFGQDFPYAIGSGSVEHTDPLDQAPRHLPMNQKLGLLLLLSIRMVLCRVPPLCICNLEIHGVEQCQIVLPCSEGCQRMPVREYKSESGYLDSLRAAHEITDVLLIYPSHIPASVDTKQHWRSRAEVEPDVIANHATGIARHTPLRALLLNILSVDAGVWEAIVRHRIGCMDRVSLQKCSQTIDMQHSIDRSLD